MLKIGREYRDGHGNRVNIQGVTKKSSKWVYSIQGNWYEQETGLFLWYQLDGSYITQGESGEGKNLVMPD